MVETSIRRNNQPTHPWNRRALPLAGSDLLAPLLRQRLVIPLVFGGVFFALIVTLLLLPKKYEARMKILVIPDLQRAAIRDGAAGMPPAAVSPISDREVNSEVELLRSREALEKVVRTCRLEASNGVPARSIEWRLIDAFVGTRSTHKTDTARAVQELSAQLLVRPIERTNVIQVSYVSRDPELAGRVLQTLAAAYREKRASAYQPANPLSFFDRRIREFGDELTAAEDELADFDAAQGPMPPVQEWELAIQQLGQLQSEIDRDHINADAAAQRYATLKLDLTSLPQRQTTKYSTRDNGPLLAELEKTLLSLQLKRIDMLAKYEPAYPPVHEVENEIAQAQWTVAQVEESPINESTTDRVPAGDWILTELAKTNADRAAFEAEAKAASRALSHYRNVLQQTGQATARRNLLLRRSKIAEEGYRLYVRKREEARISQAENSRAADIAIAEAATAPSLPMFPTTWLLMATLFAGSVSITSAYALDHWNPYFRSASELSEYLNLRVLASLPVDC
jgi:uncharacterized protein involved in exopolysaccharide biosynthesis